jgi:alpha-methylacyl-CoA racemase
VVAALLRARRDGRGAVVDTSILEGTLSLAAMLYGHLDAGIWRDERAANLLDGGAPFYACYETADGKWLAVGALEPKFYAQFLAGIGAALDPARQHDRAAWPAMRAEIARCIRQHTRDEWDARLRDTDACCTPVLSLAEVRSHPDLAPFVDGPDFRSAIRVRTS